MKNEKSLFKQVFTYRTMKHDGVSLGTHLNDVAFWVGFLMLVNYILISPFV
jgi:hypothetical protein